MGLLTFRGLYPVTKKTTNGVDLVSIDEVDFCNVPLKLEGIVEAEPVVSVGDEVSQGSLLAEPSGKFGVKIFSPICGKVLNIFDKQMANGEFCKHILIMANGKDDYVDLPEIEAISDVNLIQRLRDCGIVDTISKMPTFLKYGFVGSRSYKTLLVMMDSTDPNNTINQTLAEQKTEEVVNGAKYFMSVTGVQHVTFVFTDANYKLASKLKKHILETKKNYDFRIKFIPNKYPFDNPYIVAKLVAKAKISEKVSFLEAGVSIESAESCYNFCRAVEFNKPVTTKVVTLDGDNVVRKGNYLVPIGLSIEKLLNFAGVEKKDGKARLIRGNILSGDALCEKDISLSLMDDTLLLNNFNILEEKKENPCISCGKCASVCPVLLNPKEIDEAYLTEQFDMVSKLNVKSCINCGCCSYVCPARRFLTQRIQAAKFYDKKNRGAK